MILTLSIVYKAALPNIYKTNLTNLYYHFHKFITAQWNYSLANPTFGGWGRSPGQL